MLKNYNYRYTSGYSSAKRLRIKVPTPDPVPETKLRWSGVLLRIGHNIQSYTQMYLSYYTGYWFEGGRQEETVFFFKERMYFNLPVDKSK